ncbi:MAG: DUF433 domain-containing protein [Anaerolineae bacterium]|nr:DUF433 domain-containing protein [Anaerolineae bacterium]MBL8107266.1 DUF433 domain-containing protein [Anaerolineales bacterium]MCC7188425.1 DUF433 domain-containing protein [Anaerolineales bacterium]
MTTNRIAVDPGILGGKPCIRGTRIPVTMVLELIEDGLTFQQVIEDYYPQLTDEDIKACLQYARAVVEGEDIHFVDEKPLAA